MINLQPAGLLYFVPLPAAFTYLLLFLPTYCACFFLCYGLLRMWNDYFLGFSCPSLRDEQPWEM